MKVIVSDLVTYLKDEAKKISGVVKKINNYGDDEWLKFYICFASKRAILRWHSYYLFINKEMQEELHFEPFQLKDLCDAFNNVGAL